MAPVSKVLKAKTIHRKIHLKLLQKNGRSLLIGFIPPEKSIKALNIFSSSTFDFFPFLDHIISFGPMGKRFGYLIRFPHFLDKSYLVSRLVNDFYRRGNVRIRIENPEVIDRYLDSFNGEPYTLTSRRLIEENLLFLDELIRSPYFRDVPKNLFLYSLDATAALISLPTLEKKGLFKIPNIENLILLAPIVFPNGQLDYDHLDYLLFNYSFPSGVLLDIRFFEDLETGFFSLWDIEEKINIGNTKFEIICHNEDRFVLKEAMSSLRTHLENILIDNEGKKNSLIFHKIFYNPSHSGFSHYSYTSMLSDPVFQHPLFSPYFLRKPSVTAHRNL